MLLEEFKLVRENVWLNAWTAVACNDYFQYESTATRWADICLKEFDLIFPKYKRLDENKDVTP